MANKKFEANLAYDYTTLYLMISLKDINMF